MQPASTVNSPHSKPYTIVSLAAVAWDFPLVGRTRMLTEAWQRSGQSCIFVEAPHSWRAAAASIFVKAPTSPVPIVRPWPIHPARWWHHLGEPRIRRALEKRAASLRRRLDGMLNWDRSVAIAVTPAWAPWLEALPFHEVIYDCIDDLSVHAPHPGLREMLQQWERELVGRADAAVVTADPLAAALTRIRPTLPISTIRNAADVTNFQARAAQSGRPADLPQGRPILGFVGALYEWIDWDLIEQVAGRASDWNIVLTGPAMTGAPMNRLRKYPNFYWLGPKPHHDVPSYVNAFDVCWVPFKSSAITAAANPVKIYEYLSLGKRVVTTAVADVQTFGDLVTVVQTADDVLRVLACPDDPSKGALRRKFALANDWDHRAADYCTLIDRLLTA